MISALLIYICTASDLRDCQVYAEHVWEGPEAAQQCDAWMERNKNRVPLLYKQRGEHVFYVCDTQSPGE